MVITIDEAIADLTKLKSFCEKTNWKTHAIAIGVSIEALKELKLLRHRGIVNVGELLPGETTE